MLAGAFDALLNPAAWFDEDLHVLAWFDPTLFPAVLPLQSSISGTSGLAGGGTQVQFSNSNSGSGSGVSSFVVSVTIHAGDTVIVAITNTAPGIQPFAVTSVTDDGAGGGNVYTKRGSTGEVNGSASGPWTELWTTGASAAEAAANVTVSFGSNTPAISYASIATYTGAVALGSTAIPATGFGSNTLTGPSVSLTTINADNFVASAMGVYNPSGIANLAWTQSIGNQRDAQTVGHGAVGSAIADNTAPTASSVTVAEVFNIVAPWNALAIELQANVAPVLTGAGALAGSINGTSAITASTVCLIVGVINGTSSLTATLAGTGALVDSISGAATITATLAGAGALVGSISGSATIAAMLTGIGFLIASISGTATITATFTGSGALLAAIDGTAAITATLAGTGALASTIDGTSAVLAAAMGTGLIVASVEGVSAIDASLTAMGALAANIQGSPTADGILVGTGALVSAIDGTAIITASTASGAFSASISGAGTVLAVLTGIGIRSSVITGSATITGLLPNPIVVQAAAANKAILTIAQTIPITPQNEVALTQALNDLANTDIFLQNIIDNAPLSLTSFSTANIIILKKIYATQTVLSLVTDLTTSFQLQVQYGILLRSLRQLQQQAFTGGESN